MKSKSILIKFNQKYFIQELFVLFLFVFLNSSFLPCAETECDQSLLCGPEQPGCAAEPAKTGNQLL